MRWVVSVLYTVVAMDLLTILKDLTYMFSFFPLISDKHLSYLIYVKVVVNVTGNVTGKL